MKVNLLSLVQKTDVVAVAVSGGSDSMALLHFLRAESEKVGFKVICLNVEHGIRGQESKRDTLFVKDFCATNNIPFIGYQVDAVSYSESNSLSVEEAARKLRYDCFYDALKNGKCTRVATAHHLKDNAESVLFNLFRGAGIRGVTGITDNFGDKIIRPFISVTKREIDDYVKENGIPFVTDSTNLKGDYTRNFIRLNILPEVEKIFPEYEKSLYRFSEIAKEDDLFLQSLTKDKVRFFGNRAEISLPIEKPLFSRAFIMALKSLGVEKDWEKKHVDDAYSLLTKQNGDRLSLPKNLVAIKEYDKLTLYKTADSVKQQPLPFLTGEFSFNGKNYFIKPIALSVATENVKGGFYADLDKIPETAVIRARRDGDEITKFGGGTKSLGDFFTDRKIPLLRRDDIPLLADGNRILAVFGVAISDAVKLTDSTKNAVSLGIAEN